VIRKGPRDGGDETPEAAEGEHPEPDADFDVLWLGPELDTPVRVPRARRWL
jgi:hypothetical protein